MIRRAVKQAFRLFGIEISRYTQQLSPAQVLVQLFATHEIDAVFDVGANIGNYVHELRSAGYAGRAVSFEPRRAAHASLVPRARTDPAWVVAPPMALGNAVGETEINIAGHLASSSLCEMTELHEQAAPGSVYVDKEKVEIQTLDAVFDQYIGDATRPFLKIDTQGYELEVLEGAKACLPRFMGIQAELSLCELYKGQTLWLSFALRLQEEGYHLANLFPVFSDPRTGRLLQFDGVFIKQPAR